MLLWDYHLYYLAWSLLLSNKNELTFKLHLHSISVFKYAMASSSIACREMYRVGVIIIQGDIGHINLAWAPLKVDSIYLPEGFLIKGHINQTVGSIMFNHSSEEMWNYPFFYPFFPTKFFFHLGLMFDRDDCFYSSVRVTGFALKWLTLSLQYIRSL